MEDKTIIIATNNEHKLREIREILKDYRILPSSSVVECFEVKETGKTFCDNALLKAETLKRFTNYPILADDSGLEVFALKNEPGVYSSRYAGTGRDRDNIRKLLENLKGITDREARFVCCMVLLAEGAVVTKEGFVYGTIAHYPKGDNGFGYDPVFIPDGYDVTFAEMKPHEKNIISHRRKALMMIKEELEKLYG